MIKEGKIFGGIYMIAKRIGGGSFGEIFLGVNINTNEEIAIKVEVIRKKKRSQLKVEAQLYKLLQGITGIPKFYGSGTEGDRNYMAMELLGPSLENLVRYCGTRISIPVCVFLMEQMLTRVEQLHLRGYLHRDIKPDNFTMGRGSTSKTVYIIDYGLSKPFRDPKTKRHIPIREGKRLAGTARFASLNTHLGFEQSRRDDLECLGYTILYLLRGGLPWQGIKGKNKNEKYNKIMDKKMSTTVQKLCENMPVEFANFFYYVKELQFTDKPDYTSLKKQFKECFIKNKFERNFQFDWEVVEPSPKGKCKNKTQSSIGTNKAVSEENLIEIKREEVPKRDFEEDQKEPPEIVLQKSLPPTSHNSKELKKQLSVQKDTNNLLSVISPVAVFEKLVEYSGEKLKEILEIVPINPVIDTREPGTQSEEEEIPNERPPNAPFGVPEFINKSKKKKVILFEKRHMRKRHSVQLPDSTSPYDLAVIVDVSGHQLKLPVFQCDENSELVYKKKIIIPPVFK